MYRAHILLSVSLALAAASSPAQDREAWRKLPNREVDPAVLDRIESHLDLAFARYPSADGERVMELDLFRPRDAEGPLPAVLCIHGGGWFKGDRRSIRPVAQALAGHGYVTVSVSYRLSGEATFPAQVHDCKAAVRWLRANAGRWGIDPGAIAAIGSSAGGHLAALLATSGGVPSLEGEGGNAGSSSRIQAAVPMGAQSDLLTERIRLKSIDPQVPFYRPFLGGTQEEARDTYRLASPRHHLDGGDPPMLFLAGEFDDPSTRAVRIRQEMETLGIASGVKVIEGAPHGFLQKQPFFDEALALVDGFLRENLRAASATEGAARASRRPNVLFVIADDLRPELGCYGSGIAKTPHLDALAASGLRFDRAFCQKAVCWPSRNSFFSGLLPASLGKASATETFRASHPDIASLPQWFRRHGWHTASLGKILHNGQDDPESWSRPHFDPPPLHYALPENRAKHPIINRFDPANAVNPLYESAEVPDEAYEDGLTARAAIETLRELASADDPFFVMVGFHKPHSPFNAPARDWELYDRAAIPLAPLPRPPAGAPLDYVFHPSRYLRSFADFPGEGPIPEEDARHVRHAYLACTSYVDRLTGKLIATLEETGRRDDTLVLFTSDHGYHLGDQGLWSKHTTFENATRVPLLFAGPGVPAGASTAGLVELVDLYPTLAEMAGIGIPLHLEGRSFAHLFENPGAAARTSAYSEYSRKGALGRSVRTPRYRYTEWRDVRSGELRARELYDHDTDPLESRNLADADWAPLAISEHAEEFDRR